jgi:ABC-type dipeptide transport system, periplasmic component
MARERDADRDTGEQPALRLVPGQEGPEATDVSESGPAVAPEGHTRTFLIADVRGYTTFTAERGDEAAGALAARFALVTRAAVAEHSGRLLELRGDEALVVFTSARSAIRAALALQDRFITETLADPGLPLPVGIGLDVGEAVEVEGGYRGGALNLAARLCGAAAPGEVLASREVTHLARHVDGARYIERGTMAFKGLAEPVPVVRVLAQTVDAEREAAFRAAVVAPRRRRRPRPKLLVAGLVVVVLLAGGGAYGVVRATRSPAALSAQDRVDVVDLSSAHVVEQVLLDQQPAGVAGGAGSMWVTNAAAGTVSRLDPDTRRVITTIEVGGQPTGVVVADGVVWVSDQEDRSVAEISPDVNKVVETVPVGNRPTGIAAGPSGVWVVNSADDTVTRIDARSGKASKSVDVGAGPAGIAVTADTVWVTNSADGTVSAIDPSTAKQRATYPVGIGPTGIAAAAGALWVANNLDGTLARLDPDTGAVTMKIPVGNGPTAVAAAGGSVWVSNEDGATLVRVDPRTDQVTATLRVGGTPHGLAAAGGSLWVTAAATAISHRGGTLTVLGGVDTSIDPAINYGTSSSIAYDGLVGLRRAAGAAGTTLVPDLATAIPTPVDGGKTYAFRLRKGIRYSTGALVHATDLRRAIERQFRMPPAFSLNYYSGIRGADACLKQRRAAEALDDPKVRAAADKGDALAERKLRSSECDLSRGIETDDATGSVTFHLVAPDAEFLYKLTLTLAAAVPPGTPDHDTGTHPIPSTGPYQIGSYTPHVKAKGGRPARLGRLELVRNPHFREWSRAAQPDGYPDRIVFRETPRGHDDLGDVLAGKADFLSVTGSPRMQELKTRYAAQLHRNPGPGLHQIVFNTTKPPFNDVHARRALNYAVDPQQLLRTEGGVDAAQGTCQVLPPGFPGYAPYCPYRTDLVKAHRLVAQSGTARDRVTVLLPDLQKAVGPYLKRILTSLGYRVRIDILRADNYFGVAYRPHPQAQLVFNGWAADYPAASQFVEELFSCRYADPAKRSFNAGRFCEAGVEATIQQALALQQTQPAAAGRLWQQADREVVDQAALLPLGIPLDVSVTSRQVGNFLYQPIYGVLLDQLWVKPGTP